MIKIKKEDVTHIPPVAEATYVESDVRLAQTLQQSPVLPFGHVVCVCVCS